MVKNSYKFLFMLTMVIGSVITVSSTSWFSMWMGLEINLLSFIPLMMSPKNLFSSESSLKYFLVQALASAIFLFAIIVYFLFLNMKINMNEYTSFLISLTMLLKMGAAPFHFWFPSVMEGLNWMSNLLLMTWQKIAPMMILSYCLNLNLLIIVIFLSMGFGALGGLNQISLRKIMAFSSINHLGWMVAGMIYSENLWTSYFGFYVFLSLTIILLFNNFKLFNINQTFLMFNSSKTLKLIMFLNLLSLGGLPPFLGFFPKWMIIESMISSKMFFSLIFMLFLTLITLFFYLRMSYSALLMNHKEVNWTFSLNQNKKISKISLFTTFLTVFGLTFINVIFTVF